MRVDFGPGYRIYFTQRGFEIVILLAGGNKATQAKDIKTEADIAAYFAACLEEAGDDAAFIAHALGVIARAA